MTPERALEIVGAINDRAFVAMGINETAGSLNGVSLAEMIDATRAVREMNDQPPVEGKKAIRVVPADRLIAAAFALENFDVSRDAIVALPSAGFWHEGKMKALAVVAIDRANETDDEDGD